MKLLFIFLFSLSIIPNSVFAKDGIIEIAVIMRLKNDYSKFPQSILKGLRFSLKEPLSKKSLKISEFSHDGTTESLTLAIQNAKKLNPDIVVGGETSQFALVLAENFQDKIFITPTASSVRINEKNKKVIRFSHADDQYIKILEYAVKTEQCSNIGVIHNISYPNTDSLGQKSIDFIKSKKIDVFELKIVKEEILDKVKLKHFIDKKISCVVLFSYDDDLRKVFTVLSENNIFPLFIGGDGWGRDEFLKKHLLSTDAGRKFKGIRSLYWNADRKDSWFKKEVEKLRKYSNETIDDFHAIGYDVGKVILKVSKSLETVLGKLPTTKFEKLLTTNTMGFDNRYYPKKDLYIYKIENSEIRFHNVIEDL